MQFICRISRTSRPKPHLPRGSFWRWHGSADDGGKGSPDLGGSFSMGSISIYFVGIEETRQRGLKYAGMIESSCGGPPFESADC